MLSGKSHCSPRHHCREGTETSAGAGTCRGPDKYGDPEYLQVPGAETAELMTPDSPGVSLLHPGSVTGSPNDQRSVSPKVSEPKA